MNTGFNFFRWKNALDSFARRPAETVAESRAETISTDVIADRVDPWTGLSDAVMAGWFNNETGELFTGFAVSGADVVADIGCGDGGNSGFCAKFGARIILADIDPACIAAATNRLNDMHEAVSFEGHVTDSDPLPIASGTCTRIVCTEVIEHVPSPERLMSELARIGQPGARYLISCPDPTTEHLFQKIAHPSYFESPNHIRILSHEDLDRCVEAAGLVIESRASYGFYWTMWWALFWASEANEGQRHPIVDNWSRTWNGLLKRPDGFKIRQALDSLMPKSQIIVARKP